MSKAGKFVKKGAKIAVNVLHPPFIRTQIPSQMARPVPPLGSQLGARNVNAANFCKDFNEKTSHVKEGVPIPCHIFTNPDRTYKLKMIHPAMPYLLFLACGSKKGSVDAKDVAGLLSVKHIYEIAKLKQEDISQRTRSLEEICSNIILWCRRLNIKVQHEVSTEEMKTFLTERQKYLDDQAILKQNKLLKKK